MEGWISLHRKILKNPIICKDSETFAIWCYLLLNATHQEIPALFKGKKIILRPGQLITGILSVSQKMHIDKTKVQRTLKIFENNNQIEQQTSNRNRLVTILNWDKYQLDDKQNDKQVINKRKTDDKQVITNNNDNNIYLYLLNKYALKNKNDFSEYVQKTKELKSDENYLKLSWEEQQRIIAEI